MEFNIDKNQLDLEKTLNCGQCFRWKKYKNNYIGSSGKHIAVLEQNNNIFIVKSDNVSFWKKYFDLDENYNNLIDKNKLDSFALESFKTGIGIKILRQDLFETIITFIISQRNNMTRIRNTVNNLSMYGQTINFEGFKINLFPTPEEMSEINLDDFKLGYRKEYIESFINDILNKKFSLDLLKTMNNNEALNYLMKVKGIGIKVASCIMLFGMHRLNVFPVDTWMKKIINEKYNGNINIKAYQPYAGIIQQYMFYNVTHS